MPSPLWQCHGLSGFSQTFSPRLCKKRDFRLCIGPAMGFHVIPEEGVFSYVFCDLSGLEINTQESELSVTTHNIS